MSQPEIVTEPATDNSYSASPWTEGWWGIAIIAAFFAIFLGWGATAPLDAAVVGQGVVKVSGNRQVVQYREGGAISKLHVKEGQRVNVGDLLLSFGAQDLIAQERAMTGLVIELEASRERLLAELEGREIRRPTSWGAMPPEYVEHATSVFERQRRELSAGRSAVGGQVAVLGTRKSQIDASISGAKAELEELRRQRDLADQNLTAMRDLAKDGFAAEARVRDMERDISEINARIAQAESTISRSAEGRNETQAQVFSIRGDRRERQSAGLRETDQQLVELLPKLAAVRGQIMRAQVRAPVTGTVVGLKFFNDGAVVQPGELIMSIVPDNSALVVEARISPNDADDLVTGSRADVRFTSLEGRNYSRASGTVSRVSADSFQDERTGADYFIAEVEVTPQELDALAQMRGQKTLPLRPGLLAEVIVPIRKRTALQYLLEPLDQSIWKSFREH
jgi:HlyD family secretion protein